MINETQPCILPYTYHKLSGNRVLIINPEGVRVKYSKWYVLRVLSGEEYPERDLSSHERMMWERALKEIES